VQIDDHDSTYNKDGNLGIALQPTSGDQADSREQADVARNYTHVYNRTYNHT
jgi:hypothetical protein